MKRIELKKLHLKNFRGAVDQEVTFSSGKTTIYGANGTGKTTVATAFTWLLFGKDLNERTAFEIKPINPTTGEHIHRLETSVTGVLNVDGGDITLSRTYREKWTKKRGSETEEFTGHETNYFINEVPASQKEYQEYINNLIPESRFKLITNPRYFNSLKKEQRREMLVAFVGKINNEDIVGEDQELKGVLHIMLTSNKTLEMLEKEYAAKKLRIKKELADYPGRISEVSNMISETKAGDVASLVEELEQVTAQIAAANGANNGKDDVTALEEKVNELRKAIAERKDAILKERSVKMEAIRSDFIEMEKNRDKYADERTRLIVRNERANKAIQDIEQQLNLLREKYAKRYNEEFVVSEGMTHCKYCNQPLPDVDLLELQKDFNEKKAADLQQINQAGVVIKKELTVQKSFVESDEVEIEQYNAIIEELTEALLQHPYNNQESYNPDDDTQVQELSKQYSELTAQLQQTNAVKSDTTLVERKEALIKQIAESESQIKAMEAHNKRLDELKSAQKAMSSELASLERMEFQIERFKASHDDIVEQRVNKAFKMVTFRMYEDQINGGRTESCETLIDGVPYADANNASQINAGIDICNTFAKKIGICAPVWIDNAEAVNDLLDTVGQSIYLRVTTDNELMITNN